MLVTLTEKIKFIESVFGTGFLASNGKNFGVRCPFCAPKDVNKRKLVIRIDDDLNHCWTCGFKARTLAPLIRKFGTQEQLNTYRDRIMPPEARPHKIDERDVVEKLRLPVDFKLLPHAPANDPDVKAAWSYLFSRNVTLKDVWYYKLGVSNDPRWRRRVIMPSFDATGELNYYVGRSIDARDRRPKYDNPDCDKLPIIFNEINIDWNVRLVLCEGPFDLMKCGENAVPLLGSDINEQSRLFNQILVSNTPVALALDSDMWRTKTPKIAKKLTEYNVDTVVVDLREWGDPGAMSKKDFASALESARPMSWEESFMDRLSAASEMSLGSRRRYI